ncbi:MAG: hypothetical protein LBL46_02465 [Rickettsiales bacterium]|jgi:hypothetical protein|nr:hypothetical protein [Rickettsiales bacterium]
MTHNVATIKGDITLTDLPPRIVVDDAAHIRANLTGAAKAIIKNTGRLTLEITATGNHKIEIKLLAGAGSENTLSATAVIPPNAPGGESDISFAVLASPKMKSLKMTPAQRIGSIPKSATHSASLWRPGAPQIKYLETAGLSDAEAARLLESAFLEETI